VAESSVGLRKIRGIWTLARASRRIALVESFPAIDVPLMEKDKPRMMFSQNEQAIDLWFVARKVGQ
jgi:hypothetical protein